MLRVNIFWTGGFDSTYRICQLSLLKVEIQAYYMKAKKKSVSNELRAIEKITEHLISRESTKCVILPLIIVELNDIKPDEDVAYAYKKIREEVVIGSQYDLLSRYARQSNLSLELGLEHVPDSRIKGLFAKYGVVEDVSIPVEGGGFIEYRELNNEKSENIVRDLFGNFRFSLPLFLMTKIETKEAYKKLGFEELIPMIWFCAHPINGKPCGICTPCSQTMKDGMGYRIPLLGRILYKLLKANSLGKRMDKKLKRYYNRNWR